MNEKKLFNIKNFIKDDENKTTRLPSLRLPRDLTLGGTKQSKKVFTPNLNAVRNKNKTKDFVKKEQNRRGGHQNNNKSSIKNHQQQQRYVQSSGVFSEGVGDVDLRKISRSSTHSSVRESSSDVAAQMQVPTIKRNEWHVNKQTENDVFEDIMGGGVNSNPMDEENVWGEDDDDVKMPFKPISWCENDLKLIKKLDNVEIKQETKNSHYLPYEYQNEELFSDSNPMLAIWQLPDSFPGKGLSDDPNVKKLFDYQLNDMLEGQIGKICVRRSGKMEIYIGKIKYELEQAEHSPNIEELVALGIKDKYNQQSAAVLGQIQKQFILNPAWESLLS